MAPLESFNKLPETPVQKPTGVSEASKEYQNPSNNISEINQREKIDKSISEIWLSKEETEEIINTIISKFWNDTKTIDSILETISKNYAIDSKDKVLAIVEKQEKTKVESEKQNWIEQKYEIVKSILKTIDWENSKDYSQILEALNNWEKFEKIVPMLKSNPVALRWLALDLQKQNPKQFEVFRDTLISIDKDFIQIFDKIQFETIDNTAKLKLWTDNLNWVDLSKNVLRQEKDGAVIEAGKNSRNLSLVGSDYKLDSKLQNNSQKNAIQEVETNLKNDLKPINETLNTISSVIDYLDKAILNNIELKDIKENIKNTNIGLYTELNIENLNSPSDIKNAFVWLQTQKQKEKDDKIKEAKQKISLFIKQNTDIAKEQDEKKKDILKFLTSIGFDKIPQSITSQLIKELQSNVFTLWELNLNLKTIDLNNGRFGETDTESGGTKWKENLVKFMEKMIYWQIWAKESLFAWKWFSGVLWATVNPTEMNVTFEKSWIKTWTGWDINKMRQNLSNVKK